MPMMRASRDTTESFWNKTYLLTKAHERIQYSLDIIVSLTPIRVDVKVCVREREGVSTQSRVPRWCIRATICLFCCRKGSLAWPRGPCSFCSVRTLTSGHLQSKNYQSQSPWPELVSNFWQECFQASNHSERVAASVCTQELQGPACWSDNVHTHKHSTNIQSTHWTSLLQLALYCPVSYCVCVSVRLCPNPLKLSQCEVRLVLTVSVELWELVQVVSQQFSHDDQVFFMVEKIN